jgi:hypothetical protein
MGLATIYETPTDETLPVWSFSHAANHLDINRFILRRTGAVMPSFVLDPFDPNDPASWLELHQVMHQQQNAILGISGYDLSDVDWGDPASLGAWISQHAIEHSQANQILGIP